MGLAMMTLVALAARYAEASKTLWSIQADTHPFLDSPPCRWDADYLREVVRNERAVQARIEVYLAEAGFPSKA